MVGISRITPEKVRRVRTFSAFHNRSFQLLWPANICSQLSRWMQITLLAWLVLELTDSPLLVALVGFCAMAPMLLLGAVGGLLVDRVDRRRLLLTTQAISFLAALAMMLLLFLGVEVFWHAYLVMLAIGTAGALEMPSRRAMVLDLLGRSGVTNGVALDSVGMQTSMMLGPALAGSLITVANVAGGYVVVTLFSISAILLLRSVKLPKKHTLRPPSDTLAHEVEAAKGTEHRFSVQSSYRGFIDVYRNLAEGFRYVRGHDVLLTTVIITVLMNLLLFPFVSMIPVIARDVLGVGPMLMGILMAAQGLGALAGSVLVASARSIRYLGRLYMGGSMVALLMLLLFSFSHLYFLSLPILLVLGLGTAGFATMQTTIVVLAAREEMRGRALGVVSFAVGAGPLGALMMGGIATAVSPSFAIGLNAVLGVVALALVWLLMPALRGRLSAEEQPAPETRQPAPEAAYQAQEASD